MKLCVIGSGYVGLVAAACFAERSHHVVCVDIDTQRIDGLSRGCIPFYEPGLKTLVARNIRHGRLHFSTDLASAVRSGTICFIAVGTTPDHTDNSELKNVLSVAAAIGEHISHPLTIVVKSTVPVGSSEKIRAAVTRQMQQRGMRFDFDVVSNPEFLREGSAIKDFMKPDRVIIGTESCRAATLMAELYAPFIDKRNRLITMDVKSAEMTKYAANAMLATRITFMNQIAHLCERLGGDVALVREGIGSDRRIGYDFLFPGVGYGGSCFPKDVHALIRSAAEAGYELSLLQAVETANNRQKQVLRDKILAFFGKHITGNRAALPLAGKNIAVWGLAFKPETDDMREAPSIVLIEGLLAAGATVTAYDPAAMPNGRKLFGDRIHWAGNAYHALRDADALAIVTEWQEFRNPDFQRMKALLNLPVIFDGRNTFDPDTMQKLGFAYFAIGRGTQP